MKKLIFIIICIMALVLSGCNYDGYDWVDTNYHFDYAMIKMPDGTVKEIQVASWADAEGEQLTITAIDGQRYLVSSVNCVLVEK